MNNKVRLVALALFGIVLLAGFPTNAQSIIDPEAVALENGQQSPINFTQDHMIAGNIAEPEFHYPTSLTAKVINTGSPDHHSAIKAKVEEQGAYLNYAGQKYNLLQFHWHTLSEHTMNGEAYPMEVHFVHQREGATGLNDLLVVGVWYEIGEGCEDLNKLFAHFPEDEDHYEKIEGIDINHLFPHGHKNFQYEGSLTTPPFTESVHWIVMSEPVSVTQSQLEAFQALFPHGNTREVQALNRRYVIAGDF